MVIHSGIALWSDPARHIVGFSPALGKASCQDDQIWLGETAGEAL
jgi:hypothetical protein